MSCGKGTIVFLLRCYFYAKVGWGGGGQNEGFETLSAVLIKTQVFRDIMSGLVIHGKKNAEK
jgi:hypothetical protein